MCSMWNASRSRNGWVDNLLHIFSRVVTRRLGGIPDHVQDLFHLILPLSISLSLSLSCAEDDIKSLKYHFKKCFNFGKQNAKYHHHCHSHHHRHHGGLAEDENSLVRLASPISLIHQFLLPPIKDDIRYI